MVMGQHAFTVPTSNPIYLALQYPGRRFGAYGVDLFFVLSGFLVGGLLMREYKKRQAVDEKRFIFRRGLKIWPAYYVFILLIVVTRAHPLKTFLWQNLLHIQNYAGTSILHTWSLSVEEHFYLALALGMGWMVRRRWTPQRMLKIFAGVMVGGLVVRTICFFTLGAGAAFSQTQCRIDGLVCGVSLALLYNFFPERFEAISRRWILLSVICALTLLYLCTVDDPRITHTVGYTLSYIGFAAFLLLVFSNSTRIREWFVYRVVAIIGVYSYGIYLYHPSVRAASLALAQHMPTSLQWPVLMLLQYSVAIVVGTGMTLLVEWPMLRYRDRILPQRVMDIGSPHEAEAARLAASTTAVEPAS